MKTPFDNDQKPSNVSFVYQDEASSKLEEDFKALPKPDQIRIASEILAKHAVENEGDYTLIAQVNPKMLKTKKTIQFKIDVQLLIDGKG